MQKREDRGYQMSQFGKMFDEKIESNSRDKNFFTMGRLYGKKQSYYGNKERPNNLIYSKRQDNFINNEFYRPDQRYEKNQNNWTGIAEKKTSYPKKLHAGFYQPDEIGCEMEICSCLNELTKYIDNPRQSLNKAGNDLNRRKNVNDLMQKLSSLIKDSASSEFYINEILKIMQQLVLKADYRQSVNHILGYLIKLSRLSNSQIYKIVTIAITGKDDEYVQKSSSRVLEDLAEKQKLPENIINVFLVMVVKDLAIQEQFKQNIVKSIFDNLNKQSQRDSNELREMLQNIKKLDLNKSNFLLQKLLKWQELQEYQIKLMLIILKNVSLKTVALTELAKQPKLNEEGISQVLVMTDKLTSPAKSYVLQALFEHQKFNYEQIKQTLTMIDEPDEPDLSSTSFVLQTLAKYDEPDLSSTSFVLQALAKHQELGPEQVNYVLGMIDKRLSSSSKSFVLQALAKHQELNPEQINHILITIITEYDIKQKTECSILIERLLLKQKFSECQINAFLKMIFDFLFQQDLLDTSRENYISDELIKKAQPDPTILDYIVKIRKKLELDTPFMSYWLQNLIQGQQLQEYQINLILIMIPKTKGFELQSLVKNYELTENQIESIINSKQITCVLQPLINQGELTTKHVDQILNKIASIESLKIKTSALLYLIKGKILQSQQITEILSMINFFPWSIILEEDNTTQSCDSMDMELGRILDNLIKKQTLETKHIDLILDIILTSHSKRQFSNILINLVKTKKISSQKKEQINNVLIIALKFKEVEAKTLLEYLIGSYKLSYEQIDKILKFCLGCRPVINDFKYVKSILKRLFDTKDLTLTTEQINTISKHIIARFTCKKQNELSRMLIAYQQKLLNQQKSPKDFEISSDLKELIKDISDDDTRINKMNGTFTGEKELDAYAKSISEKQTNSQYSKKEQTGSSSSDSLNFLAKEKQKITNKEDLSQRSKLNMLTSANNKTVNILLLTKKIVTGLKQSSQNKSYPIFSKYKSENDGELSKLANESMSENNDKKTIKAVNPGTKIKTALNDNSLFTKLKRKRDKRDERCEAIPKQKRLSSFGILGE